MDIWEELYHGGLRKQRNRYPQRNDAELAGKRSLCRQLSRSDSWCRDCYAYCQNAAGARNLVLCNVRRCAAEDCNHGDFEDLQHICGWIINSRESSVFSAGNRIFRRFDCIDIALSPCHTLVTITTGTYRSGGEQ